MKKVMTFLITICMIATLAACGQETPAITSDGEYFSMTAVDIVDYINSCCEEGGDDYIQLEIKDDDNVTELEAGEGNLYIQFDRDKNGFPKRMELNFYTGNNDANVIQTAGMITGLLITAIAPEDATKINENIKPLVGNDGVYTITVNNAKISFDSFGPHWNLSGWNVSGWNTLEITATENE